MSVLSDLKARQAAQPGLSGAAENANVNQNANQNTNTNTNNTSNANQQNKVPTQEEIRQKETAHAQQHQAASTSSVVVDKTVHLYSSPTADGYSLQLASGDVKAVAGLIKATPEQHEEIQALLRSGRPDISQNLVLLDVGAAERIAKADIEARAQAGRGAAHSGSGAERNHTVMQVVPVKIPGASDALNNTLTGDGRTIPVRTLDVIESDAIHADDTALLTIEGAVPPAGPPKS